MFLVSEAGGGGRARLSPRARTAIRPLARMEITIGRERKSLARMFVIDESYRRCITQNIYRAIEELQADLNACAGGAQKWRPYSNRVQ